MSVPGNLKQKLFSVYPNLFSKPYLVRFHKFLFELSLRGLGVLNSDKKNNGEKFLFNYLKNHHEIDVVVDVGANVGDYTYEFLDIPSVFCLEPHPETFKKLKQRFRPTKCRLFELALSDFQGETKMYDIKGLKGSELATMYEEVISYQHKAEADFVNIKVSTLDRFVEQNSIDRISLLKLDTEGSEYKILKGASDSLNKGIVDIIHFEFNYMNVVSRVLLKDYIDLLSNFNLYRLLPDSLLKINYYKDGPLWYELYHYQNIIAIRKDIDLNER